VEILKRELPGWFKSLPTGRELIEQSEAATKTERQERLVRIRDLEAANERKILLLRATAAQAKEKAEHDRAVAEASVEASRRAEYAVSSISDMSVIENLRHIQRLTGDPDDQILSFDYEMEAMFERERRIPAVTHQIETGEYFRVSQKPVYVLHSDLSSRERRLAAIRGARIEAREVVIYEAHLPHELKKRLDDLRASIPEVCLETAGELPPVEDEPLRPGPVSDTSRKKALNQQFKRKEST
jgi:hypothetical protein